MLAVTPSAWFMRAGSAHMRRKEAFSGVVNWVIGQFVCPLTGCHSVVLGYRVVVWNSFQSMPVPYLAGMP